MLDRIKIPALAVLDYFRGRVVPMYRRSNILWCSYYMTFLGRTFLRTPIFTDKDENKEGLGPLPEYMRKDFYYWKTDRTVEATPAHINGSILKAIYCNKMAKFLGWRLAVVSLMFCTAVSMVDGVSMYGVSKSKALYRSAARAVHSIGGPAKASDDTDDLLPSNLKDAIAAARTAQPALSEAQQANVNNNDNCADFLADLQDSEAAVALSAINTPSVMRMLGEKLDGCRKAGYAYHADVVTTLKPFHDRFLADSERGKWMNLLRATMLPGRVAPLSDFATCDTTIASVLKRPSSTDPVQAHAAADCLSNGSTLPAPAPSQDD